MNSKHRKTLLAVFTNPVRPSIHWSDIESLSGQVREGKDSRVRIKLNGVFATFHRPHPRPTTDKGTIKTVREFLENAGVKP